MSNSRKALEDLKKARDVYQALAGAADAFEEMSALEKNLASMEKRSESLGQTIDKQEANLAEVNEALKEADSKLRAAHKKNMDAFKELTAKTDAFVADCEKRSKAAASEAASAEGDAEKAKAELAKLNQQVDERKVVLTRMVANAG